MEKRKPVRCFEDLMVWQMGMDLVKRVYLLTAKGTFSKDFGLRDQIRRASVSIPTNIAEGFERRSRKEYLLFLNIAKGSAGEVRSLLRVAFDVGYLERAAYETFKDDVAKLSAYMFNHIKAIKNSQARTLRN
jgi:four helix bundle protein